MERFLQKQLPGPSHISDKMKGIIFRGRRVYYLVSRTFEKPDVLESANLPGPTNLIFAIVSLVGLAIYQLSSSAVYVNSYGNLINSTISSLVYAPYGWLQTIAFYVLGISILVLAILLQFKNPVKLNLGAIAIALMALAFFLIGACPEQFPGGAFIGNIHQWAAIAVSILLPVAGFLVAANYKTWNHRSLYMYTIINSAVELLFVFVGGYFLMMHQDPGLFERVLMANGQIWLTVICLNFLLDEAKIDFPVISRARPLTMPAVCCLLFVYGAILWPLSLSFIK